MAAAKYMGATMALVLAVGGLAGCHKKDDDTVGAGPAEQAGRRLDQVTDKAGRDLTKAAAQANQQIQDAAKDASKEINKATDATGKKLEEAGQKLQEKANENK